MAKGIRIDKFLFHARFCKTRAIAQAKARQGRIRLNGEPVGKSHILVKPGDILTVPTGGTVRVLKILALGERRGPAEEARTLYELLS